MGFEPVIIGFEIGTVDPNANITYVQRRHGKACVASDVTIQHDHPAN